MSEAEVVKKKPNKKLELVSKGIVILCICIVVLYFSFLRYSNSTQSKLFTETYIFSTKIIAAVETYQKDHGSIDLTGLDKPKGTIEAGFVEGSPLFDKLSFNKSDYKILGNFDIEDFYIEFVNDGKDGRYIIVCEPARCKRNGVNGRGPVDGFCEIDPENSFEYKFYPTNIDKFMHNERKKK